MAVRPSHSSLSPASASWFPEASVSHAEEKKKSSAVRLLTEQWQNWKGRTNRPRPQWGLFLLIYFEFILFVFFKNNILFRAVQSKTYCITLCHTFIGLCANVTVQYASLQQITIWRSLFDLTCMLCFMRIMYMLCLCSCCTHFWTKAEFPSGHSSNII